MSITSTPLVSVCVAAYNSAHYIEETLDCLFSQTYPNIEIIVVDDGSKDETEVVLKKVQKPNFRYFQQTNRGAATARNIAYSYSKGDFVKFMDADDLINPKCIASQVLKIKEKPGCIASAAWGRFYLNDISTLKVERESVWKDMAGIDWIIESLVEKGRNMMQCGMFLIPRTIIEKAGLWNESLSLIDDFEYMIRIISLCSRILFCEDAVLKYRSGISNSLSRQKSRRHMESAFNAVSLGVSTILNSRNDSESRLACANVYQDWAGQFYPDHQDLYKKSLIKIKKLGGSKLKIEGGRMYVLLVKIFGWERAKILRKLILGHY